VSALPDDQRALAVVGAMTRLGQALGMTVTAEGAETQQQTDLLWDSGVDQVQGFALAAPMPEEELLAWLQLRQGAAR
jgi:EAL domain-containing protein (putative c-di-GMP-specific phosphodiesterase class I)